MGVLVINFDSVGDAVFQEMAKDREQYPNVANFMGDSFFQGGIKTVFVSNTYPVHTSVSTGKLPKDHGVISNYRMPNKKGERSWAQMAHYITAKTIWDAAKEKNLTTAAFLWPVTCGAKIDYHVPEVHPEKGQSLLVRSLMYGSVFFQLSSIAKYRHDLIAALKGMAQKSSGQPALDNFTTSASCDALKKKKPDLTLVHLLAYDTEFHYGGSECPELLTAKKSLDENLGRLLKNCSPKDTVIVFSDHSQLDVNQNINLNDLYSGAFFDQAGGSAFAIKPAQSILMGMEKEPWFSRYLSKEELKESGYENKALFGIAAKAGFCFTDGIGYKGNHGYPSDYENYHVFYAVKGKNFTKGNTQPWLKKRITDVTAIIAKELELDMDILAEYGVR
ncbi:MAG: alkaline phosphatase family protein [Treponema sp.]|nr:alkaline phosphatase family protein [Treponema sp.]